MLVDTRTKVMNLLQRFVLHNSLDRVMFAVAFIVNASNCDNYQSAPFNWSEVVLPLHHCWPKISM